VRKKPVHNIPSVREFFLPRSVAVIGASRKPGKIGHTIVRNLKEYGFSGKIYPINPHAEEIEGFRAYPSILDVPGPVDLAVIAVPARIVPAVMGEVGKKGVPCAAVISSGFKEVGNEELEREVISIAKKYGVRVLGPNIFGVVYTPAKLNATFGPTRVREGNIALISQSGALGIALMGWTQEKEIGLSAIVSVGNKADVAEEDLLPFFAEDPNTRVVVVYMEGVKNGRAFMRAVRAFPKPIVVVKSGRSKRGMQAAASHTGSLAGSDRVYDGVFKQVGILRADTVDDAFVFANALSRMEPPQGDEFVIITNGGGIGVLATDWCEKRGIKLYSGADLVAFKHVMPPFGSWKNPVDITGMADETMYTDALHVALETKQIAGIILLYCQTAVCSAKRLAEGIVSAYDGSKPLTVGMVGGTEVTEAIRYLNEHGIPAYDSPERAVDAMYALSFWARAKKKRS